MSGMISNINLNSQIKRVCILIVCVYSNTAQIPSVAGVSVPLVSSSLPPDPAIDN